MLLKIKLPNGSSISGTPEEIGALGVDVNAMVQAAVKVGNEAGFSSGVTATLPSPTGAIPMSVTVEQQVLSGPPSEQSDPWLAAQPGAPINPNEGNYVPPVATPQPVMAQPMAVPAQQPVMATPVQPQPMQPVYQQPMAQPVAQPAPQPQRPVPTFQPGVYTVQTDKGPQTWELGLPGAESCSCGVTAARQSGTTNGRNWSRWTCAQRISKDTYKNACSFNKFVGGK